MYYLVDGKALYKDTEYYFFVMEFINGRQVQETVEGEFGKIIFIDLDNSGIRPLMIENIEK